MPVRLRAPIASATATIGARTRRPARSSSESTSLPLRSMAASAPKVARLATP